MTVEYWMAQYFFTTWRAWPTFIYEWEDAEALIAHNRKVGNIR